LSTLCDRLPARAVVWTIVGSKESRLLQPVHAFCGVPVAQAPYRPPRRLVRGFARRLAREGRPLYLLAARRPPIARIVRPPALIEAPVVLKYLKLEESVARRPSHRVKRRLVLYLARVQVSEH
jgi:hypothetical protein